MPHRGQVDIRVVVPEAVGAEELESLARGLAPDERERAAAFALEAARRRFIVTRALLRRSLSRYADVAPEGWVFSRGPHGKPRLDGAQAALGLCFNVSHTAGLGVCAVARSEVGVDVQNTTHPLPAHVRERYLTELEREELRRLPESERVARFFEYWTLKEAYVKARGLGFSLPLGQIGFCLKPLGAGLETSGVGGDASSASLLLGPGCPDDGCRFWLKTWRVSGEHRMAVALAKSSQGAPASHRAAEVDEERWPIVCVRHDA
jgi:4'-phosphopantetheinyl transferase